MVQQFPFGAHFKRLALFRVEAIALAVRARVRLVRASRVGVDGHRVGQVVDHAQARRDGRIRGAPACACGKPVAVGVFEVLEAQAGQHLEALGQRHLILHEGGPGLEVFLVVRGGAGQGRARLAQYRVKEVDWVGVGARGRTLDDRLVVVVFHFHAGQQGVAQPAGVEVAGQVQLDVAVGPVQLAVVEVAAQRAAVGLQRVGFNRVALQGAIQPLRAAAQLPVVVQRVFKAQLHQVVVVVQFVVGTGFPHVGVARGASGLVGVAGQATVQRVVVAHQLGFQRDAGGGAGLPTDHGRNAIAFGADVVTEAVAAFGQRVEAVGQAAVLVQRAGGVEGGAAHALRVELRAHGHARFCFRLLGDHVERAAGVAPAVQAGVGAPDHFKAFQRVGIGRVGIAAIHGKAVAVVLAGGEAAHGDRGQPLSAKVVGSAYAARVIQHLFQARCTGVLDHVTRHHADGLRHVVQRGVGARGA
ncbi:hypothetical protein D3C73_685670 [compost metagenome]